MKKQKWIGVDLDGTLAYHASGDGVDHVGRPIKRMVERVKSWLAGGYDVRIFTARIWCSESGDPTEREFQRVMIEKWCLEHIGAVLPITCQKDYYMMELWDDRAVAVERNTGDYKSWETT